jgi:predicted P-loop ATPase
MPTATPAPDEPKTGVIVSGEITLTIHPPPRRRRPPKARALDGADKTAYRETVSRLAAGLGEAPQFDINDLTSEEIEEHDQKAAEARAKRERAEEKERKKQEAEERRKKREAKHPLAKEAIAWLGDCMRDDKDRVIANLANLMIGLRSDPRVTRAFAFDEMMQTTMIVRPLPVAPNGKAAESDADVLPRPIRDADASQLQEWMQHQGLPRIGRDIVHQAVDQRARERGFHPVRRWLEGLIWDGTPRLDSWLKTYCGATGDEDYLLSIGRMFLISMIARVMKPGCKADYMLVLEGDQGAEKSQACAILAGDYFSDGLPDIHHKDASQHMRGKWLIEVSELATFTRAEVETLKAFISRSVEKYRPPYGREDVVEPRQCVFIGTTNKETYLKDETGGRRFWPVVTGIFDLAALRRDRDQLFAEAADRYLHGEQWWPDPDFERQHIKPQQDRRYEDDPWRGHIAEHIADLSRTTITAIARNKLGFDAVAKIGTADQRRIAGVLASLGWHPGGRDGGHRYYEPKKVK